MLLTVPCSAADTVALFDAATGADAGRISVGSHPVHLAAADGRVLVATMGERSIDVITDGTTERVPTGVLGPSHFATCDHRAFVPCTGGDAVAVIDLETRERRERVPVGPEPHDAERFEDAVYVGSRGDGTVTVLDAATAAVQRRVDISTEDGASQPRVQGLTAAADGVYAVDQSNSRVLLLGGRGVIAKASVGSNPYEAVVADDRVFVPGRSDGTVTALSPDLSSTSTHSVGERPVDLAVHGGNVWVFDRDRSIAESLGGSRIELPHPGFAVISHPEQPNRVFVSHYDDDTISALDLTAGTVEWTASAPARPFEPLLV